MREAEKTLGLVLVEKQAGGYAGGGATLTPKGRQILQEYKLLKNNIDQNLELFLTKIGHIDSVKEEEPGEKVTKGSYLLLASTMEPVETGLLDELEKDFYKERGVLIRHIAAGSGKALDIARAGRVDMALTHAPGLEKEFMDDGWGVYQYPVMTNDFIIIGPKTNPAKMGIGKKELTVTEALRQIAASEASFVSRGDYSGTHLRETEIWEKSGINPGGNWYHIYPGVAGNLGAIHFAREKNAYTITDMASFRLFRDHSFFAIYLQNNNKTCYEELKNIFVLTLVNPEKVPSSRMEEAIKFARWLQKEKGRKIIEKYGRKTYKKPLFAPVEVTKSKSPASGGVSPHNPV